MFYYHLRYNIYPNSGFPVEKEQWIELVDEHDETQMKELLTEKHHAAVTLILSSVVCQEEYVSKISQLEMLPNNEQINTKRIKTWLKAEPQHTLKGLQETSALNDLRYRHVLEPAPLL